VIPPGIAESFIGGCIETIADGGIDNGEISVQGVCKFECVFELSMPSMRVLDICPLKRFVTN
jgi:hypothetical protein